MVNKYNMNQLVQVYTDIYKPEFNENTDSYVDKSPYKPYERNCIRYECRCRKISPGRKYQFD